MKNGVGFLSYDIEKRLHRVKIEMNNRNIKCEYAKACSEAENSYRCNEFYQKCTKYKRFK
jgi:hypothetical protein